MFVQRRSPTISRSKYSVYARKSNYTTVHLCKMSLTIQSIDTQIAHGGIFHDDQYPELKANDMLINIPFNSCSWFGKLLEDDESWVYGLRRCDVDRGPYAAKNKGEVLHG